MLIQNNLRQSQLIQEIMDAVCNRFDSELIDQIYVSHSIQRSVESTSHCCDYFKTDSRHAAAVSTNKSGILWDWSRNKEKRLRSTHI